MEPKSFLGVDFAALRTLILVHKHRSFTAAADVLDVNQSAVSYTIDKLRNVFGDPLFFRQGAKVMPTERCETIVERSRQMLDEFELMAEPVAFDPGSADRTFVIACNYYERVTIIPELVRRLRLSAPGVRLDIIASTARGDEQLREGAADVLIGPMRPEDSGFFCRVLFEEHYVCMLDRGHPLAAAPAITREDYLTCSHVVVTYGGTWRSGYLQEIAAQNLRFDHVVSVPSPAGLAEMVSDSDLVATVPRRIADAARHGLHVADSPFPAPFQIDLVWTTRTNNSAPHSWLREQISEIAKAMRLRKD